jgi:acetyltransferase-like isoleucine patch superfamily enzyme
MSDIKTKLRASGNDVIISELADIIRPELVSMGDHIAIDQWTYISTQMEMGSYIHIAPSVTILGGAQAKLIMGNFTNIGSGSRIICATDDFKQGLISPVVPLEYRTIINEPIVFEDFATLGVNCCVLPGVTLAEGTIVGAGSVIMQDTHPWMIYAGSPAKAIKPREKTRALKAAKELGL